MAIAWVLRLPSTLDFSTHLPISLPISGLSHRLLFRLLTTGVAP